MRPDYPTLVQQLEALQSAGAWPNMLLEISNVVIGMLNDARAKGLVFRVGRRWTASALSAGPCAPRSAAW